MSIARLCKHPNCPRFRLDGSDFCSVHQADQVELDRKMEERKRKYYETRKRVDTTFYNTTRWKQLRAKIISAHPYCSICGSKDNLQCHHTYSPEVPYLQSEQLFFNEDAIQVICRSCHTRISNRKAYYRPTSLNYSGDTGR